MGIYIILLISAFVFEAHTIRICDHNKIAETVKFRDKPVCPSGQNVHSTAHHGSIMLFKPNLRAIEVPAHICQYQITTYKTRMSFFGSEELHETRRYYRPVARADCIRWVELKRCTRDNTISDLRPLSVGNVSMYHTMIHPRVEYAWMKHQMIKTTNCILKTTWVRAVSPFKTVFSQYGVVHNVDNGILDKDQCAIDQDRTIIWHPVKKDKLCSYVLFEGHQNNALRVSENGSVHFVLTTLQRSIYINEKKDVIDYEAIDFNYCLVQQLNGFVDVEVYKTSGGGLLSWFPGQLLVNASTNDSVSRVVKRSVGSKENTDMQIFLTEASVQWFADKVFTYTKSAALNAAREFCEIARHEFDTKVLLAELNPSSVISSIVGKQISARKQGDVFAIVPCKTIERYKVLSDLKIGTICYSLPLINFTLDNGHSILTGQLDSDGEIKVPPIRTENCKMLSREHFLIDDVWYHFEDYRLNPTLNDEDFQFLELDVSHKYHQQMSLPHLTIEHIEVYTAQEQRPIVGFSDIVDNLNRNAWVTEVIMAKLMSEYASAGISVPPEAIAKGFNSLWLESTSRAKRFFYWIKNSILDPIFFFFYMILISVGSGYGCVQVTLWLFSLRRCVTNSDGKRSGKTAVMYTKWNDSIQYLDHPSDEE